jgi:hypothetical protein
VLAFSTTVCPVDFSDHLKVALERAAAWARPPPPVRSQSRSPFIVKQAITFCNHRPFRQTQ